MLTIILLILWLLFAFLGSISTQSHIFGLFVLCAIVFPILTLILIFRLIGLFFDFIGKLIFPKKKYREINAEDKEEHYRDPQTEHIVLNNPEYIGVLTKIDKKRIAEEYLDGLKKDKKHGKSK